MRQVIVKTAHDVAQMLAVDDSVVFVPEFRKDAWQRVNTANALLLDFDHLVVDPSELKEAVDSIASATGSHVQAVPKDPFADNPSGKWDMRAVKSDIFISEDIDATALAAKFRRAQASLGQLRKIAEYMNPPAADCVALMKKFAHVCLVSHAPSELVDAYVKRHGLQASVVAPVFTEENGLIVGYEENTMPAGERLNEATRRFVGWQGVTGPETVVITARLADIPRLPREMFNVAILRDQDLELIRKGDPTKNPLSDGWMKTGLVLTRQSLYKVLEMRM